MVFKWADNPVLFKGIHGCVPLATVWHAVLHYRQYFLWIRGNCNTVCCAAPFTPKRWMLGGVWQPLLIKPSQDFAASPLPCLGGLSSLSSSSHATRSSAEYNSSSSANAIVRRKRVSWAAEATILSTIFSIVLQVQFCSVGGCRGAACGPPTERNPGLLSLFFNTWTLTRYYMKYFNTVIVLKAGDCIYNIFFAMYI